MLAGSVNWDAVDDRERRWLVYWVRDCELLDLEENGEELVGPIADLFVVKSSSDAGENTDSKTRRRAGMMGSVGGIADVT